MVIKVCDGRNAIDRAQEIQVSEHDTFGNARRPAGVDNASEIIALDLPTASVDLLIIRFKLGLASCQK